MVSAFFSITCFEVAHSLFIAVQHRKNAGLYLPFGALLYPPSMLSSPFSGPGTSWSS
jgi:hypothetical protein